MTEEKRQLLTKIHSQINKKKQDILNSLPVVHSIEDGIVIRFFSNWEQCEDDYRIKFRKIQCDNPEDVKYNFFLPKGTILDIKKREYAGCITCLSGEIELEVNGKVVHLSEHMEKCLENDVYHGKVIRDAYLLTEANPELPLV
jgi:hypothetical protein